MLFQLLTSLLILTAAGQANDSPWFGKQCPQAFQDLAQRTDVELRAASLRASGLRRRRLQKPREFRVGEETFTATHKLGESSGLVYLGRAPGGKTVVIKQYLAPGFLDAQDAERMVRDVWAKSTVLSGEPGGPPKVLAVDLKRGTVVTEYFTGLGHEEVSGYHLGMTRQQENQNFLELGQAVASWHQRRQELAPKIRAAFLNQDPPPGEEMKKLGPLPLDVEVRNFLYSFKQKRWVFFDP